MSDVTTDEKIEQLVRSVLAAVDQRLEAVRAEIAEAGAQMAEREARLSAALLAVEHRLAAAEMDLQSKRTAVMPTTLDARTTGLIEIIRPAPEVRPTGMVPVITPSMPRPVAAGAPMSLSAPPPPPPSAHQPTSDPGHIDLTRLGDLLTERISGLQLGSTADADA
jgi:hypothetical protein